MSSLTDQMIFLQDAMSAAISSADSELASLPVSQSFITPAIPQLQPSSRLSCFPGIQCWRHGPRLPLKDS